MTIHAGPYIQRTIRYQLGWARQFREDAAALEAKAAEKLAAAIECERKAASMAAGTDFNPPLDLLPQS